MIVLKFGGTSVSTPERIQTICEIVKEEKQQHPVVVVSAIRGVTDLLLSCLSASRTEQGALLAEVSQIHLNLVSKYFRQAQTEEIQHYISSCIDEIETILHSKKAEKEMSDSIVSYGEKLSAFIISKALLASNIPSVHVDASRLIVTNDNFTNAEFLPTPTTRSVKREISPLIKQGRIPVITGFIGATKQGAVTTLGRGGSDYSAAIIGYALDAAEIQIWTDVDGIFTADPRVVSSAKLLPEVTYREASELASFGAKVLHPRTIRPALSAGIPVLVRNTLHPQRTGTRIISDVNRGSRIAAITLKREVTMVNLYSTEMLLQKGFLERVFSVFAKHNISIDLVSVSEVSVSLTLDNEEGLSHAIRELEEDMQVATKQVGVVSLIGEGIVGVPRVMRNIFSILDVAQIPTHMVSIGASDINISLVTNIEDVYPAVNLLHEGLLIKEVRDERIII